MTHTRAEGAMTLRKIMLSVAPKVRAISISLGSVEEAPIKDCVSATKRVETAATITFELKPTPNQTTMMGAKAKSGAAPNATIYGPLMAESRGNLLMIRPTSEPITFPTRKPDTASSPVTAVSNISDPEAVALIRACIYKAGEPIKKPRRELRSVTSHHMRIKASNGKNFAGAIQPSCAVFGVSRMCRYDFSCHSFNELLEACIMLQCS